MDPDSIAWVSALSAEGDAREESQARLHRLLMRVAWAEARRRAPLLPQHTVADFDDLCTQAANDALVAILRKLTDFQGLSRFTTWASKFVILEISSHLRRSAWRNRRIDWSEADWDRLEEPAAGADQRLEQYQQMKILREAMLKDLSERQRHVLTAVVLDEVPTDVLAERMSSSRGAIYKILHDARTKLREALSQESEANQAPASGTTAL